MLEHSYFILILSQVLNQALFNEFIEYFTSSANTFDDDVFFTECCGGRIGSIGEFGSPEPKVEAAIPSSKPD